MQLRRLQQAQAYTKQDLRLTSTIAHCEIYPVVLREISSDKSLEMQLRRQVLVGGVISVGRIRLISTWIRVIELLGFETLSNGIAH